MGGRSRGPLFSLGLRASLGAIFGSLHHQVIGVLATIMNDPKVAAAARVAATNAILDRGWGKLNIRPGPLNEGYSVTQIPLNLPRKCRAAGILFPATGAKVPCCGLLVSLFEYGLVSSRKELKCPESDASLNYRPLQKRLLSRQIPVFFPDSRETGLETGSQ